MSALPVLAVHGGCGVVKRGSMSAEVEADCRRTLKLALERGYAQLLARGGDDHKESAPRQTQAVLAVREAIRVLEDSPHFNAGKGAAFSRDGTNECDAGIMDGSQALAGGVSCATSIKNPILAAHEVMLRTPHVLLCGAGADTFARSIGLECVPPDYFFTARRWELLQAWRAKTEKATDAATLCVEEKPTETVGAVALDREGHLAAGSSTGGLTGRYSGRVSDSSVVGSGFFADSRVALSATGNGDAFLRSVACHRVAALVEFERMSIASATRKVISETPLAKTNAGLIALNADGNVAMPYNTDGMFRGWMAAPNGDFVVSLWED